MDWKKYEELTKYIYETLGKRTRVKIECFGSTCKVKGKSNTYHQIDVLTSHSDGVHNYKTAIECKYWNKKVNQETVMKMVSLINDTRIDKGVIVSKEGFTKNAVLFANENKIGLVVLREAKETNGEKEGRKPVFKILEVDVNNKVEVNRPKVLLKIEPIDPNSTFEELNPYNLILQTKTGIEIPLNHFLIPFQRMLHTVKQEEIVEKHYDYIGATIINIKTREEIKINGFKFEGKLEKLNKSSQRKIDVIDEVWMIMKSHFENESFSISKMGIIKRDK